jgi:hypothetical protein
MLAINLATLMKKHDHEIAAAWHKRVAALLGQVVADQAGGGLHGLTHAVGMAAEHLKSELPEGDLKRWSHDLGRTAHEAGLPPEKLLAIVTLGRHATRDFINDEEAFGSALEIHAAAQLLKRNAAFFDQAGLYAMAALDAAAKGHAHPADAPHLFK